MVPTYFNVKASLIGALIESGGADPDDYDLWSLSGMIGMNYFLTDPAPTGLFVGAWVDPGYIHGRFEGAALEKDGGTLTVDSIVLGGGAHVGYRVLLGPVAITPRIGAAYRHVFTEAERRERGSENDRQRRLQRLPFPVGHRPGHRLLKLTNRSPGPAADCWLPGRDRRGSLC